MKRRVGRYRFGNSGWAGSTAGIALAMLPVMASAQPQPPAADQLFIHAGRLLADPASGRVERDRTIVVAGGKVVEIREGFVGQDAGNAIDLRDSFVLPGLIDSHVHITGENSPTRELDFVKKTSEDRVLDGVQFAKRTLEAGFTTVVNLGAEPAVILALRDGIAAGKVVGPRIIAGLGVGTHGGHGDIHGFRPEILELFASSSLCSGADDCRRATRQAVQRGADVIKIASTGGVMSNVAAGVGRQMFDDELAAIVETAHSLGRRVACHAHAADGINAALRAGVDSIEHGSYLDAESIRLMKASGAYLVPTLLAGETVGRLAETAAWMPANVRAKAREVAPQMMKMLRSAREAGVKVAFGTDSGVSPHGQNAREFSLMVKAGYPPIDTIRAATVWGAAHNRMSDQIGTLAAGKAADLIAVRGDPLQDVTELERVTFVLMGGKVARDSRDRQ